MSPVFALVLFFVSHWLWACGHPVSTVECDRLIQRYQSCALSVAMDESTCAQRFGRIGSACAKSFSHYAQCIEATSCTTLTDPNASSLCKNEFISLDIDCDGADFSP